MFFSLGMMTQRTVPWEVWHEGFELLPLDLEVGSPSLVTSSKQALALASLQKLAHFDIQVKRHATLNYSRGVISAADLYNVTEEEILENMAEQNVSQVRRITIRRDGQVLKTKHLILTFATPDLPQSVKVAYLHCPVRPYIPNPLRCFQCQRFGHSKTTCRGQPTCARCAEVGHDSADSIQTDEPTTTTPRSPTPGKITAQPNFITVDTSKPVSTPPHVKKTRIKESGVLANKKKRSNLSKKPHDMEEDVMEIHASQSDESLLDDLSPRPSSSGSLRGASAKT
ncbi:uncharacterized protein TNCV_2824571 [Trichonephila clavipes]|nr:uncharacterized protein TNCV_2824571 [Trichonephila clavipes]